MCRQHHNCNTLNTDTGEKQQKKTKNFENKIKGI